MGVIAMTGSAAGRIAEVLSREAPGSAFRIAVDGGGCSGFRYAFTVAPGAEGDDVVLERDGAVVLVDPTSAGLLAGAEIDWVDDLVGSAFRIRNPNVTASCGCGTSFAL